MMPMQASRRGFRNTLIGVSLLVCIGGLLAAFLQSIPAQIAVPVVLAFTAEAAFYLIPGIEVARELLEQRLRKPALALWMVASALAPYLIYSIADGIFGWVALGELAALAAVISFWYVVLPRNRVTDLAFLAIVAAGVLANPFAGIYGTLPPRLGLSILGQLMWTRLSILAALSMAGMEVEHFGFLPTRKEFRIGVVNFALFLPAGAVLGWAVGFAKVHLRPYEWWQYAAVVLGTFLGMFWVVALREEFFFRGLLQRWLTGWLGNEIMALLAASVLFGLMHLNFQHRFPNWKMALLATIAGVFYGRAYLTARSVRAAMVTHALVNTVWRAFF